jgi:hypothetical protein
MPKQEKLDKILNIPSQHLPLFTKKPHFDLSLYEQTFVNHALAKNKASLEFNMQQLQSVQKSSEEIK